MLNKIGTAILAAGLALLSYGAAGFWLINALPPNGGIYGRLPSIYVICAGSVIAVAGLSMRGLRFGKRGDLPGSGSSKRIPAAYGIVVLVALVAALFIAILRI
jgi:hypothetical protein